MTGLLEGKTAIIYGGGGGREGLPRGAEVATFLASDQATGITGSVTNVTAGLVFN